jgi:putative two-component system response regulator
MPHKILVVDDEPANLRLLRRVLGEEYETFTAESGQEALRILKEHDISLIVTDQRMPHMTGVQLLEASLGVRPDAIKILLTGYTDVQALIDAINSGRVYKYIPKPWDADELRLTVRRALETYELKKHNEQLLKDLQQALAQLEELSMATIRALADALDAKCDYTSGHSLRVSRYAVTIGRAMGLPDDILKDLELAGILHDVGKIGVPESILWKPARLTPEEQAIMAQHPVRSAQIIGDIPVLGRARDWVLHHHEYMDGSGYPDHLVGEQIPLGARIILVADAYDAMTTDRPYRKAIGYEKAATELRKYSGKQFDGQVVEALLSVVGDKGEGVKDGIPESFLGLILHTIDPAQLGTQFQAEAERQSRLQPGDGVADAQRVS